MDSCITQLLVWFLAIKTSLIISSLGDCWAAWQQQREPACTHVSHVWSQLDPHGLGHSIAIFF